MVNNSYELAKSYVQEVRNKTIFNLGQSGIKGAQEILKILDKKKTDKNHV